MIPEMVLVAAAVACITYVMGRKAPVQREAVIGRITRRSICRVGSSEYVPLFEVQYQFGGTPYVTEITGTPCRHRRDAQILLERESVGVPRPILINPDKPTEATAQIGWSMPEYVSTAAYAAAAMAVAVLINLAKGRG